MQSWQDSLVVEPLREGIIGGEEEIPWLDSLVPPFQINNLANKSLFIIRESPVKIECDAVAIPNNERLDSKTAITEQIFALAGEELVEDCKLIETCHTGDAVFTRGFNLPARYIIHGIGPRWNDKYKVAAESTLHLCYKKTLQLASNQKWESICISPLYQSAKSFPKELAIHTTLRTIRRFFDMMPHTSIKSLMLSVIDFDDYNVYASLLPLYFPRDKNEEIHSAQFFDADKNINVGDEWGEVVLAERKIRIKEGPSLFHALIQNRGTPMQPSDINSSVNKPVYDKEQLKMRGDHDKERLREIQSRDDGSYGQYNLYYECLYKSHKFDYSQLVDQDVFYNIGINMKGQNVFVFIGERLTKMREINIRDLFLSYFTKQLDMQRSNYIVIYVHTGVEWDSVVDSSFLAIVCEGVLPKITSKCDEIIILHPTIWFKGILWSLRSSIETSLWNKIKYAESLSSLAQMNSCFVEKLKLPSIVYSYEQEKECNNPPIPGIDVSSADAFFSTSGVALSAAFNKVGDFFASASSGNCFDSRPLNAQKHHNYNKEINKDSL